MKKILFGLSAIFFAFSAYADNIDQSLLGADKNGAACQQIDNNTTLCWKNNGGSIGGTNACQNKRADDSCSTTGTAEAKCQTIDGLEGLRCTAKKCKPGYFLWVTSKRSKNVKSYEDYQSQGVCIHESWCDTWCATCPDCTECKLHTFTWHEIPATDEICYSTKNTSNNDTTPAPDSDPGLDPQNDKGCNLTFADGTPIENVDWAESAKPGYDDTDNKITLIKTPVRNITSVYKNKNNEIIKQNESNFSDNYYENVPHLFDLTHINNSQIPQSERDKYTDAVAIIFKCNNGKPEITPIVSVPVPGTPNPNDGITLGFECESGTMCQKFDVFSAIDEQISYLQRLDDHFFTGSSVWKTDAGKFNTARLASDSIAGVVLGTAGGIITSKIVKKNQIKNGFEDLKCTIGGQVVATYGDEFTVNVK